MAYRLPLRLKCFSTGWILNFFQNFYQIYFDVIREVKIHVYAKRHQIQVENFLRIENQQIKTVQQFICIELTWNYLFFSWSYKQLTTVKGKTWSGGTNSRLPFRINVNLDLSNDDIGPSAENQVSFEHLPW